MKTQLRNWMVKVVAAAILAFSAGMNCEAQDAGGGGRLAGTWDAAVTIRNCATGDAITNFASIGTFNFGGTFIGSSSGMPQAARTPEHGVWRHIEGNNYMLRFKTFSFNASGVATGYSVVTHQIELSPKANSYFSEGIAQHYLLNGTQVGQGCSDAIGTRLEL
ncbi:MAG: hypothetical protein QUS14_12280 [Pyrinomonadaceae bacterium]|nr:hypothetical protein [Pyrinomonadaceae bacterium]